MDNIQALRSELIILFHELKAGGINSGTAKELNNSAGKIINSAKVQLEYYTLRKEQPKIPFLEVPEENND